jgi:hypothetical protein
VHLSAPAGGCRITGASHIPEWQKTYSSWLLFFRYWGRRRSHTNMYGGKALPFLWAILRSGPLRRDNLLSLRRWYPTWKGLVLGAWCGFRAARGGVRSPFVTVVSK